MTQNLGRGGAGAPWLDRLPWLGPLGVLFVAGAALLATTWHPAGDYALDEIIVRHLWHDRPLYGPYSALRPYHHPLPWVYVAQWPAYLLFDRRSSALLTSTVWLNAAAIALIVWLSARLKALGLGVLLVAAVALFATQAAPGHLSIPWNPFMGTVPAVALVAAAWRTALGDRWTLPVTAGLAVWCAGAHIAFVPTAGALTFVALVGLVVGTVRVHGRHDLRRLFLPAGIALALVVLLVSPAVVDYLLNGSQSNPQRIAHWLGRSTGPRVPSSEAWKAFFGDLSSSSMWATGKPAVLTFLPSPGMRFPIVLLVGAVALGLAIWRRAGEELMAFAVVLTALGATLWGLLNVQAKRLVDWYQMPMHAMAMSFTAITAWSLMRSAAHFVRRRGLSVDRIGSHRQRALAAAATTTLLAIAIVPTLHEDPASHDLYRGPLSLVPAIERRVPKSHVILLRAPYAIDGYYSEALALELDRAGYTLRVPKRYAYLFTSGRTQVPPNRPVTTLYTTTATEAAEQMPQDSVMVAQTPPSFPGVRDGLRLSVWLLPDEPKR